MKHIYLMPELTMNTPMLIHR